MTRFYCFLPTFTKQKYLALNRWKAIEQKESSLPFCRTFYCCLNPSLSLALILSLVSSIEINNRTRVLLHLRDIVALLSTTRCSAIESAIVDDGVEPKRFHFTIYIYICERFVDTFWWRNDGPFSPFVVRTSDSPSIDRGEKKYIYIAE